MVVRSTSLIHHYDVEGVLGLGECEHRPLQWPRVSSLTQGTKQVRIRFVRQRSNPALEQTNKGFGSISAKLNGVSGGDHPPRPSGSEGPCHLMTLWE